MIGASLSQFLLRQNQGLSWTRTLRKAASGPCGLRPGGWGQRRQAHGNACGALPRESTFTGIILEEAEQRQLLPTLDGETEARRVEQPAQGHTAEQVSNASPAPHPLPFPQLHSYLLSRFLGLSWCLISVCGQSCLLRSSRAGHPRMLGPSIADRPLPREPGLRLASLPATPTAFCGLLGSLLPGAARAVATAAWPCPSRGQAGPSHTTF